MYSNSISGSDCKLLGRGCAQEAERGCRGKCLEDLQSTTRYVTWSLHTKSRASLKSMLNRVSSPVQLTKEIFLTQSQLHSSGTAHKSDSCSIPPL